MIVAHTHLHYAKRLFAAALLTPPTSAPDNIAQRAAAHRCSLVPLLQEHNAVHLCLAAAFAAHDAALSFTGQSWRMHLPVARHTHKQTASTPGARRPRIVVANCSPCALFAACQRARRARVSRCLALQQRTAPGVI